MIRVLLVDDHELVRTGFRHILDGSDNVDVVGEAKSGEEALVKVKSSNPDLVLMDVNMPGIGGIEATRKIKRLFPSVQVIAVTIHSDTPFPEQLHDAGALGYVTKGCPAEELFEAIQTVAGGKPFISNEVSKKLTLARINGRSPETPFSKLSQREMQVFLMITQGHKTQEISDSLCLSPKTVSTYRHRLFEKLDVKTDVDLTHLALRFGLIGNNG
ncbi:MAG: response regulator [Chromatiaceae bacterium]|nr:response regulator [Gammaproteobacteria bacterium]MCP5427929.1 response regulator [Chromatiaceae bacterium]MCB1861845.1 response regulator [Gammaproteobacteria bacterium]MCB1880833.1 response regulator [Gammaproteobacteria bacterium]MCB1904736.1 response regulator [Gammaproteobacteria bacterium]